MTEQILKTAKQKASKNELIKLDSIKNTKAIDEKELIKMSHIKRFYERWKADLYFREQLLVKPEQVVASYSLKVDIEEVRPLWDTEYSQERDEEVVSNSVKRFQYLISEELRAAKSKHSLSSLKDPRFKAWRERQIARAAIQFHPGTHDAIVHAPMCFELSKGCSVGCWFCGISAPRFSDIFTYTQENTKLWSEVLELMKNMLGSAVCEGFCYWATDPFDNPDYEKFCSDFHKILGIFPQTTTAQPLKDPERTRSLLKLSAEKGCKLNRFSILSLKMFNQVHEEFSAEELAFVNLILQNQESIVRKANAGRARERNKMKVEKNHEFFDDSSQETIACVTGFLFNMVDRSVKLISPCRADDRWPLGYRIYDEGIFSDTNDLKILLERMITNHMLLTVRFSDRISFPRDLKYESLPDGFQLSTRYITRKFLNQPYLKELGEVIQKGDKTAREIILFFETLGVPRTHTFHTLNVLFNKGILDDEPQPNDSK